MEKKHKLPDIRLAAIVGFGLAQGIGRYVIKPFFEDSFAKLANLVPSQEELDAYIQENRDV